MDRVVRVAGVQMEPVILDKERNLVKCLQLIQLASKQGARLIVFPEAALSGYVFDSLAEAKPAAETIPGPSTEKIIDSCRQLGVYVVVGLLEKDRGKYYNAAAFLGPSGLITKYRKLHLPYLGVDRFVNHGNLPLEVFNTDVGRIGLGICYDSGFPEHGRVLMLKGADIIVIITNWPQGREFSSEHMIPSRARENLVYYVAVNRVGDERGVKFFGRSKIADCSGATLAEGKPYEEDILYAEIELAKARKKKQVFSPGKWEIDALLDRRPEFYGEITKLIKDNPRIR